MYKKFLLAYDGSVEGRLALREGAKLAKICEGEVFLLAVVNLSAGIMMAEGAALGAIDYHREAFEEILAEGVVRLEALGFSPAARLEFGDPAQQISAVAKEIAADIVVVGHRQKSSLAHWWRGSVGASLLETLQCSLLIAQSDTVG